MFTTSLHIVLAYLLYLFRTVIFLDIINCLLYIRVTSYKFRPVVLVSWVDRHVLCLSIKSVVSEIRVGPIKSRFWKVYCSNEINVLYS